MSQLTWEFSWVWNARKKNIKEKKEKSINRELKIEKKEKRKIKSVFSFINLFDSNWILLEHYESIL
jgi:hypothetical protein